MKQYIETVQSRFSLSYRAERLLESLLGVVLNSSERNPNIPKRHEEKKKSEDLTESPIAFLVTLILHVALKGTLDVDNEEEVDGYKATQTNIEKCSMNSGVRGPWGCLPTLYRNLHEQKLS